jgi:hypothetical protein
MDIKASIQQNVEEQLISAMAKIPCAQHQANSLLYSQSDNKTKKVEQLLDSAGTLDDALSDWAHSLNTLWAISAATNLNLSSTSNFTPRQVHKYSSFYVARVWNMYRVARLIVQSILLRTISLLPASSTTATKTKAIEKKGQDLVDGICASVPFLLGQRLAGMKAPASAELGEKPSVLQPESSNGMGNARARTGRFSLIWPLYVACSASFISKEQRRWLCAQLQAIAECGEPHAHFALCTESRILTGGTEFVRFDCV